MTYLNSDGSLCPLKVSQTLKQLFDETETLKEEIKELEEELEEKIEFENIVDIARDLMERIKAARWKVSMGVRSQEEELENLHDKLEEVLS